MEKTIKIISSVDRPIKQFLNNQDYNVYEVVGRDDLFTIEEKTDEQREIKTT